MLITNKIRTKSTWDSLQQVKHQHQAVSSFCPVSPGHSSDTRRHGFPPSPGASVSPGSQPEKRRGKATTAATCPRGEGNRPLFHSETAVTCQQRRSFLTGEEISRTRRRRSLFLSPPFTPLLLSMLYSCVFIHRPLSPLLLFLEAAP